MKRPQSAKPGHRGYWGQASSDDIAEESHKNQSRKPIRLMKPDMTTHDFARILPKKIPQDKERLYSEALQLKQSLNEVLEENVRLKTKISILEKEKDKMNKFIDHAPEASNNRGNSRLQLYTSKMSEKQNVTIRNLKKLVRDSREENEYLKVQTQKIKKTIKYTKINELEIEKKILLDQNKRLAAMLEDCSGKVINQEDLEHENRELKKYLEEELEQNKQLSEENQKYEEIIEELEEKIKSEAEKYQTREKKLQRDLALEKRKANQNQKYLDDLRKEIRSLQNSQNQLLEAKKKQVIKPVVRPTSSYSGQPRFPHNYSQASQPTKTTTGKEFMKKDTEQAEQIKEKNEELEKELREIKMKLQQSENELKKRALRENSLKDTTEKIEKTNDNQIFLLKKEDNKVEKVQKVQKVEQQRKSQISEKQVPVIRKQVAKPVESEKKIAIQSPQKEEEQSYQHSGFQQESYAQQFQKSEEPKPSKKPVKEKQSDQIQKLKKDFEENEQEEELYKKQASGKKDKKEKQNKDDSKKKKKGKQTAYKPDKKMLSEIKELLTYRMKSQRYPFVDLKADIESAETANFTYADLCNMLVNEPFYLTSDYTKSFLSYCYEKQKVGQEEMLENSILIAKLRKVIEQFELMDENQEKEMIVRIAEMTSTYPEELQTAFDNIKNGEETVSKKDLIEMFQKLELQDKYIDLIIAQLSLCSDDLEHLNFVGFFERFYIDDEEGGYHDNNAIEEQGQESEESYKNSSRIKKHSKPAKKHSSDEEDNNIGHYMLAPEQAMEKKGLGYDEDDIVSDDGRI